MPRADLLALTDDGLVQLSNAGLVKRGLREIAEGAGPQVEEGADGAIGARFADGTTTRLAPDKAPADAVCTCPASGMCRHRVALVLAYRAANGGVAPSSVDEWDPGALDLAALEVALPTHARNELARLRAASVSVRLSRRVPPSAAMPMATVRFLAPYDAAYARCDCIAGAGCAHVALAVEAFRAAQGANEAVIGVALHAPGPAEELRALGDAVLQRLLREGATAGVAAHGSPIDRARERSEALGATWLALAFEALGVQVEAYDKRSALYDEDETLAIAAEIWARPRARNAAAMGFGEALETAMGKTRLISLGARLSARGRDIEARVALFDTDTGAAMLMGKLLAAPSAEERIAPEAALARLMAPGLSLRGVARGQVLTSAAHRRADGAVRLGSGARGRTTLLGRGASVGAPAPLRVTSLDRLRAELARQPPALLAPRNRVQHLRIFDVDAVVGQSFAPGAQVWRAAVALADGGGELHLERTYNAGAPAALDVLAAAFDGRHGALRQIAGQVRLDDGAVVCEPWSLGCDTFVVPDCDGASGAASPPLAASPEDAHGFAAARRFLAGALHAGVRRRDADFRKRGHALVNALSGAGFATTAERMNAWLATDDVAAFGRLAVWLAAALEQ